MLQTPHDSVPPSTSLSFSSYRTKTHSCHCNNMAKDADDAALGIPSEFPYEFDSPVESVAGSTETESSDDEEDFFAAFTRRLSLHDARKHQITAKDRDKPQTDSRVMAGSPQSILSGIGSWSGRSTLSGEGSPNGPSRVPSPSTAPFAENNDPWEAIFAAAGQVARVKCTNAESASFGIQNRGGPLGFPQGREQQCISVWGKQAKPNWLLQQHQQVQNRTREFGHEAVKCTRSVSLNQPAWTPSQQVRPQNHRVPYSGSGSRVGAAGGSGSSGKRGCGGTGVFLPRHYGNNNVTDQPRVNKSVSAPVLVPAKVVHALNLSIDDIRAANQLRLSEAFATDYDALLARRNALLLHQRLTLLRREEAANYEIRLPKEWTY